MVINENNSQLTTFTRGMNSDLAYDQLPNQHYVYGKNIRITKNQMLGSRGDYSSLHEGIVTPVVDGVPTDIEQGVVMPEIKTILAIDSVDNYCTIVYTAGNDLSVVRLTIDEITNVVTNAKQVWICENFWDDYEDHKVSTVLYKELENVIKLYIATGKEPLIILRVDDDTINEDGYDVYRSKDVTMNNRIIPQNRIFIEDIISGRLHTGLVQYTYRLYNKYANTTQLAPLTNKILVIDSYRNKENGNAEDTETSLGFTITIDKDELWSSFLRIQVYRLHYIKPGLNAEVYLIYDDNIPNSNKFVLNDVGIEPLLTLTMEEFSAMSGLILVPQTIALNQNYMFCGNVKDDTIIKGLTIKDAKAPTVLQDARVVLADSNKGSIPQHAGLSFTDSITFSYSKYFKQRGINPDIAKDSYDNIITSSLLRSLRRGETYKYAIVFYDKYGRRSDIQSLPEVTVKEIDSDNYPFELDLSNRLVAKPIGVKIEIPTVEGHDINVEDIIGCQIVRRSSSDVYQKTLLLVALARPVNQGLVEINQDPLNETPQRYSPYYPTGFLSIDNFCIRPTYYFERWNGFIDAENADNYITKTRNTNLFLIFSSEIDYRRNDVLQRLSTSDMKISEKMRVLSIGKIYGCAYDFSLLPGTFFLDNEITIDRNCVRPITADEKSNEYWIFNYFNKADALTLEHDVKSIKDIKIPNWEDGFTEILRDGDFEITSAIKRYKLFETGIDLYTYNNWCSFGKYNFRAGNEKQQNVASEHNVVAELLGTQSTYEQWYRFNTAGLLSDPDTITYSVFGRSHVVWKNPIDGEFFLTSAECYVRLGYIGAGGSCFLLTTTDNIDKNSFNPIKGRFCTSICNITHNPKIEGVQSDEQTTYFGFGNYFPLEYNNNSGKLVVKGTTSSDLIVFDGDIYITPHELTTMYKTYNFESIDTIQSTQITNYIPLESKVNTFFDYGMNLRNTNSANLLNEPGTIEGISSLERPAHQYNMIYSDNDLSNDVFTLISTDLKETNEFKQRAYFSEPKTNGEFVDNYPIFKTASFIDVDSQYGQITNLDADKNNLFYWQDSAFGKFSVNERSLINDTNGNTIMLGLAGILSRYDYLSTKYGMRLYDFCSRTTENGIYWVDINNKAIVASGGQQVVNFGEQVGVQNILNHSISSNPPLVDYDLLNNELLCNCLEEDGDANQLVFNVKYNMATSIYTHKYDDCIYIKNHLFGIKDNRIIKYNYLPKTDNYLHPMYIEFVVNQSALTTKVFDSLQITPIKRAGYLPSVFNNTSIKFETDLYSTEYEKMDGNYTDREGNIIYNIPRFDDAGYGARLRGKWMKVDINCDNPTEYTTISHVITKFRQSFS